MPPQCRGGIVGRREVGPVGGFFSDKCGVTRPVQFSCQREDPLPAADVAPGVAMPVLDDHGDYTSFRDLLGAAQSDVRLEVEGRGELQHDGSIVASVIEAEVKD